MQKTLIEKKAGAGCPLKSHKLHAAEITSEWGLPCRLGLSEENKICTGSNCMSCVSAEGSEGGETATSEAII